MIEALYQLPQRAQLSSNDAVEDVGKEKQTKPTAGAAWRSNNRKFPLFMTANKRYIRETLYRSIFDSSNAEQFRSATCVM